MSHAWLAGKNEQTEPYAALWRWGATPLGRVVANALQHRLAETLPLSKSAVWLQCGGLEALEEGLSHIPCRTRMVFSPERLPNIHLLSSPKAIALGRESVDVVFFPFSLHAEPDEQAVLSEADRVLRPEGFIIVAAINPISFAGAQMRFGAKHAIGSHTVYLHSPWKIAQIMRNFDYTIQYYRYWEFRPPCNSRHFLRAARWLNFVGSILAPWPPQFYMQIYQKKALTPSLVGLEPWSIAELRSFV